MNANELVAAAEELGVRISIDWRFYSDIKDHTPFNIGKLLESVKNFLVEAEKMKLEVLSVYPQYSEITSEGRDSTGAKRGYEQILEGIYWLSKAQERKENDWYGIFSDFNMAECHLSCANRNLAYGDLPDFDEDEAYGSSRSISRIIDPY